MCYSILYTDVKSKESPPWYGDDPHDRGFFDGPIAEVGRHAFALLGIWTFYHIRFEQVDSNNLETIKVVNIEKKKMTGLDSKIIGLFMLIFTFIFIPFAFCRKHLKSAERVVKAFKENPNTWMQSCENEIKEIEKTIRGTKQKHREIKQKQIASRTAKTSLNSSSSSSNSGYTQDTASKMIGSQIVHGNTYALSHATSNGPISNAISRKIIYGSKSGWF